MKQDNRGNLWDGGSYCLSRYLGEKASKITNLIREGDLAEQELQVVKKLHKDTCEICRESEFSLSYHLPKKLECRKKINTSDIIVRIVLGVKSFVEGDLDGLR
nr:hypothetical protein Cduv_192 [Cedratvirus duvanny]